MTLIQGADVRVRFAPSPTGPFHIGGARTALFNWLFARQHEGVFVLRIEDTDKERSSPVFEKEILESLAWLGIDWDEGPWPQSGDKEQLTKNNGQRGQYGPYRQSERTHIYEQYIAKLLETDRAYYCYCTKEELEAQKQSMIAQGIAPRYSGHCRGNTTLSGKTPQVIRFKTPEIRVEVKDIIRKNISFDASLFGDFAIAKDPGTPLYNFAAVVDDYAMKISHVIRGEDHLSNTPKQILLQRALGFDEPIYAHLPLILAQNRSKLSKRYAEVSLLAYKTDGYLPEALLNFIAMLGWHPHDEKEIFTADELQKEFTLDRVQKAGAVFNIEKLDWLNREHIKLLSGETILERIRLYAPQLKEKGIEFSKEKMVRIVEAVRERMRGLHDFFELADFFFELPEYETELLVWSGDVQKTTKSVLEEEAESLENLKEDITIRDIKEAFKEKGIITKEGAYKYSTGAILWPFRVALSGKRASPDPFTIAEILGKEETLRRLNIARDKFGALL